MVQSYPSFTENSHEAFKNGLFLQQMLKETLREMERNAAQQSGVNASRLDALNGLADWVARHPRTGPINLVFICTHNSRRSHFGQLWAQAAAWHFELNDVHTFSGGTEATAFNPRAVRAMQELGVGIEVVCEGENSHYTVQLQRERTPIVVFSKEYGHSANPQSGYAAVMVCDSADAGCPVVHGAAARFSIPYVDPKASDGTDAEQATYRARAMEIGTECFYVMARAAELRAR